MPLKVVYVDDEVDLLSNFHALFDSEDVQVTIFSDPDLALQEIPKIQPDLVVLDYRLPNTTGDQVALKLPESLHKVLLTGELDLEHEANFRHVFRKPLKLAVFEAYLEEHFPKKAAA